VKTWNNSLFKDWSFNFYAVFDDFLILKKIPDEIDYLNFDFLEKVKILDL